MDDLPPHTEDTFLDSRVRVLQPRTGHRSGLDAVLLAACVPASTRGALIDFGSGVGVAGHCAAARCSHVNVTLIDNDPTALALARASLDLVDNTAIRKRIQVQNYDLSSDAEFRRSAGLADGSVDHIIANPPYNGLGHRRSPDSDRANAHMLEEEMLDHWIRHAAALLKPAGSVSVILRPQNLPDILTPLSGRFGAVVVKPVHPRAQSPASRILVSALKGRRTPLTIAPPLILHQQDGSYTRTAEMILRGREAVELR